MFSEAVVKDFNVFKDIASQFVLISEYVPANRAAFVTPVERFHRGVVVAVAFATHALSHGVAFE